MTIRVMGNWIVQQWNDGVIHMTSMRNVIQYVVVPLDTEIEELCRISLTMADGSSKTIYDVPLGITNLIMERLAEL